MTLTEFIKLLKHFEELGYGNLKVADENLTAITDAKLTTSVDGVGIFIELIGNKYGD